MKKFLLVFLTLLCVITCAIGLVACGDSNSNGDSSNNTQQGGNSDNYVGNDDYEQDGGDNSVDEEECDHDWGEWSIVTVSTCSAKGEERRECSLNSSHFETRPVDINPEAHSWDNGTVTKTATCLEKSEKTFICAYNSKHMKTEEGYFGEHTPSKKVYFNDDGHWKNCLVCGEKVEGAMHYLYTDDLCTDCDYEYIPETTDLDFRLNDDNVSYYVNGMGSSTATKVKIPATYMGLPVTKIVNGAFYNTNIVSVIVGNNVTEIGLAFARCAELERVVIGDSVTELGMGAFQLCEKLEKVIIGDGLKAIANSTFNYCYALKYITIGSGVESIGAGAFYGCSSLESIVIPAGVKSIAETVFVECTNLKQIIILGSPELAITVFHSCSALESVVLPDSADYNQYIYLNLFANATLKNIYFSGSKQQWEAIEKYCLDYGYTKLNADVHFYSEEKPHASGSYWHFDIYGEVEMWK